MVILAEEQLRAWNLVEEGHNILIHGQAGTGKSVLVREVATRLREQGKVVAVTASTGIASRQFRDGRTLHEWCGIRDGRYNNDQLYKLLCTDEERPVYKRVLSTHVLIIDEISMVSRKVLEQVEYVCRCIRDPSLYFGGLQLVFVGDFRQIPPQANDIYKDAGLHPFTSVVWEQCIPHKVFLTKILRQENKELIKVINELEEGSPTEKTDKFLFNRDCPVAPGATPVYLYATNLEVNCHNSEQLRNFPGEMFTYKSDDFGEQKKLEKVLAQKVLLLKKGSPVMLLRNLSTELVNGLIGEVVSLDSFAPTVKFGDSIVRMTKVSFEIFDPWIGSVICARHQFPLKLAFAMTIHKSQGQTLPEVVVDCRNIYLPGQLGVAVGRCVTPEGLYVRNYHPSCCKKHKAAVTGFCVEPGLPASSDISCCKKAYHGLDLGEEFEEADTYDPDFCEDSDFDEEDLKIVDAMEKDAYAEPGDAEELTEDQLLEADNFLAKLHNSPAITPQQKTMNSDLHRLRTDRIKCAVFIKKHHDKVTDMYTDSCKSTKGRGTTVDWAKFLRTYHEYLGTADYKASCGALFHPSSVNTLVCGSLMTEVRKKVCSEKTSAQVKTGPSSTSSTGKEATIRSSAYGKIRYVGGRTIAKLKYRNMKLVRSNLNSVGMVLDYKPKRKVTLLQSVIISQGDAIERTEYPESIVDTQRKQNLACGLTNISDRAFEFFLHLEMKRLPMCTESTVLQHGCNIFQHIHETVFKDSDLFKEWASLFTDVSSTVLGGMCAVNSCESVLEDIVESSTALCELYQEAVQSYLNVSDADYRRKLTVQLGKQKTMEHRKQVLTSKGKKSDKVSVTLSELKSDKSENKMVTHLKLKAALLQKLPIFQSFTKKELLFLGECYDTALRFSMPKERLVATLTDQVIHVDKMPNPEWTGDSDTVITKPGSSEACSSQVSGAGPSGLQPSSNVKSSVTRTRLTRAEEGQEKETDRRKCHGKGKGKGKGQGKGKGRSKGKAKVSHRESQADLDEDMCYFCGSMYFDDDPEPWICCTECEQWVHRSCGGISKDQWEEVSQEGAEWRCPLCQ